MALKENPKKVFKLKQKKIGCSESEIYNDIFKNKHRISNFKRNNNNSNGKSRHFRVDTIQINSPNTMLSFYVKKLTRLFNSSLT